MYPVRQWLRFIFIVVVVIYVYQIEPEFVEKSVFPALNGLDIFLKDPTFTFIYEHSIMFQYYTVWLMGVL